MTNEGSRRVECCSNGLLHVEEDGREEREQRTPINKKNTFHLRFIDSSEPESLSCLCIFELTLSKSG